MFHRNTVARPARRIVALAGAVTAAAIALSGCSTGGGAQTGNTDADKYGTAANPITLKFWTWGGTKPQAMIDAYEKAHPHIKLDVTLFGGTAALYTKLATVLKAGTGVPDATGLELATIPTFSAGGKLVDLSQYDVNPKTYDAAAVASATIDGKVYAAPTDTGPMVMYYNTTDFDKLGLTPPTTWAEYQEDAVKMKAAGISMAPIDPGDSSLSLGLIWQAGGRPFDLSGTKDLNINLADEGTAKFSDYWTGMIQDKLVNLTAFWSNDWFHDLADGHYATWITGAWGGQVLASSIPQAAGTWKAAPIPQWTAGAKDNGQIGGSGTAVTSASKHPAAAAAFANWFGSDWRLIDVADAANQPFPAAQAILTNPQFLDASSKMLGGQKPDPLYVEASSMVSKGWQFLPYNLYANSIYPDTVGKALTDSGDYAAGLKAWQEKLSDYGTAQGFKVTNK